MAPRLPALTSLRFLAALAVIAHHTVGFVPGYGGVSLFFVLSGFVLARGYRGAAGAFWLGRIRRIVPTHVAMLILALPLGVPAVEVVLTNAMLLQSWIPDESVYFSLNAVAWSLSVEAFFYLCFPLVARVGWRQAAVAAGLLAIAATAAMLFGMSANAQHAVFYINPLARLPEFMVGIALANGAGRRLGGGAVAIAWGVTAAAAWALPLNALTAALAFLPASALTIAYAAEQNKGWLIDPRLILAGEASFTLYMIAHLFQRYAQHWIGPSVPVAVAAAVAAIGIALLWHSRERLSVPATPRHSPSP